jgi:uncharacterized protein (UPF0332 family)
MIEEFFDRQQLIDYRMERARETLSDARILLEQDGSPGSIINRAYYAMFYVVLALLTTQGKGSSKHSGVISLFDQLFIKTGKLPKDFSKAIHKAFDLRQIGDYRELIDLNQEQAIEVLNAADQFLKAVQNYLHNE